MNDIIDRIKIYGLNLKQNWIESELPSITTHDIEQGLLAKALVTDLCLCSNGLINPDLQKQSSAVIQNCIILQIQSLINIALPADSQFSDSANRMLKMELTDGITTCYAIEYSPIPSLSVTLKKGTKISIKNVQMKNQLLLLNASNTIVLGGHC